MTVTGAMILDIAWDMVHDMMETTYGVDASIARRIPVEVLQQIYKPCNPNHDILSPSEPALASIANYSQFIPDQA